MSGVRMATCFHPDVRTFSFDLSGQIAQVDLADLAMVVQSRPPPPTKIITIMRCLDLWFLSPLGRKNSGFKFASVFRRCGMWCQIYRVYEAEMAWMEEILI